MSKLGNSIKDDRIIGLMQFKVSQLQTYNSAQWEFGRPQVNLPNIEGGSEVSVKVRQSEVKRGFQSIEFLERYWQI